MHPNFDQIPGLHPTLLENLQAMKLQTMTEIQALTWDAASNGQDVLARARTGTGKTISFLLPSLQQLLHKDQLARNTIHMLILSPTRELAMQIDDEAQKLTNTTQTSGPGAGHPKIRHQVIYGGSSRPKDVAQFERNLPTILVATPGRLRDHLDNTSVRGRPFRDLFHQTSILVLDETDRLLDMGFQKEVNEIIQFLPPKDKRQTLLFSATVPKEVKAVMAATMKKDFATADCIHDQDPATHTNEQVEQRHVIVPYKTRLVTGTVEIIWQIIENAKEQKEPLKMVVFFNTANLVGFYASLFNDGLNIPVLELHSRKSQSYRTKTADKFRSAKQAILFTSDVSARGVDYPGVTHVVQVGIAESRESYIHRLGRTGRAGKQGEGLLILSDLEQNFLDNLNGIDVPVHADFQNAMQENVTNPILAKKLDPVLQRIRTGKDKNDLRQDLESAYRSMLGFYNGKLFKMLNVKDPALLIDFVNEFAKQGGCAEIPGIEKKTIGKMGLRYTTGLNITANLPRHGGGGGGGGGGGTGRYGGGGGRSGREVNVRGGHQDGAKPRAGPPKRQISASSNTFGASKKPKPNNGGDRDDNNGNRRRRRDNGRGNNNSNSNRSYRHAHAA